MNKGGQRAVAFNLFMSNVIKYLFSKFILHLWKSNEQNMYVSRLDGEF